MLFPESSDPIAVTRSWVPQNRGLVVQLVASYPFATATVVSSWRPCPFAGLVSPYSASPRAVLSLLEERLCSMIDRPASPASRDGAPLKPSDKDFKASYPTLWAWMTDDAWKGGEARQRSSLLVFAEEDELKACLMNKDDQLSLWASARSFTDLLVCLETRLKDSKADWRMMKDHPNKQKQKRR